MTILPAEPYGAEAAAEAAAVARARLSMDDAPHAGIILGSGLGGITRRIEGMRRLSFAEIPGFAATSVAGHDGALIAGRLAGRDLVALAGRFHIYEGHPPELAGFPARVIHALGAPVLLVSNAAGAIRPPLVPGDLMVIADHINLMWRNPLIGMVQPGDDRFPDMSDPYDAGLRALLRGALLAAGEPVREGVYAGLSGPTYETLAEVRMLDRLGADAVGMSTVPEVLVACAAGMKVAGLSCITNYAAGRSLRPPSHEEVLETASRVEARMAGIVERFVAAL